MAFESPTAKIAWLVLHMLVSPMITLGDGMAFFIHFHKSASVVVLVVLTQTAGSNWENHKLKTEANDSRFALAEKI